MNRILDNNLADFISMCRPLIREPNLVKNIRLGKSSEAMCDSCNKCFASTSVLSVPLRCFSHYSTEKIQQMRKEQLKYYKTGSVTWTSVGLFRLSWMALNAGAPPVNDGAPESSNLEGVFFGNNVKVGLLWYGIPDSDLILKLLEVFMDLLGLLIFASFFFQSLISQLF